MNIIHPYDQYYGFLKLGWKISEKVVDEFLETYSDVSLNSNQRNYLAIIFGDLVQRPPEKLIAISTNGEIPQYHYNPSRLTNRKILTVFKKLVVANCLIHLAHDKLSNQRRAARYQLDKNFHALLAGFSRPIHDKIKSYDSGGTYSFIRFRHPTKRDPANSRKWIFIPPPHPVTKATKKKNKILSRYNSKMYHWGVGLPGEPLVLPSPLYSNFIGNRPAVVGRIQGGYLNKFKKDQRPNILIDDQETVYLDFQGFNTRALHALNGKEYNGDPYDINGRKREKVKALATVLLNVDNELSARLAAVKSYKNNYPDDGDFTSSEAGAILQAFKVKHAAISKYFFKPEVGFKLMSLEAEVAFNVLDVFINNDKCILPIHDGFVVKVEDQQLLDKAMMQAYSSVFDGIPPVIA